MTNDGYYMRGARSTSTVTLTPMRLHETCGLDVLLSKLLVFNYYKCIWGLLGALLGECSAESGFGFAGAIGRQN